MRVAVISNPLIDKLGPGDFFYNGFKEVCEAEHFKTGEEIEGFDHYFYVDDGPSYYDAPKFHPATYLAIDFVIPHVWFVNSPETYIARMRNFDQSYVFTTASLKYCQEQGLNTKFLRFAADPTYHHHYAEVEPIYDWVAIWHNCENRPQAIDEIYKVYPNGLVSWKGQGPTWGGAHDYSYHMCSGKCALNYPRSNMVNMRVYEVMAIGVPLITMRVDDMHKCGFAEGDHYLGFNSNQELIDQMGRALYYPEAAQIMAKRAQEFVLQNHTYKHRALELLDNLI